MPQVDIRDSIPIPKSVIPILNSNVKSRIPKFQTQITNPEILNSDPKSRKLKFETQFRITKFDNIIIFDNIIMLGIISKSQFFFNEVKVSEMGTDILRSNVPHHVYGRPAFL